MKFDADDFSFQDEINLMNLKRQMENQQLNRNPINRGFNQDVIDYHIENK